MSYNKLIIAIAGEQKLLARGICLQRRRILEQKWEAHVSGGCSSSKGELADLQSFKKRMEFKTVLM
jgi:hypothetical protein